MCGCDHIVRYLLRRVEYLGFGVAAPNDLVVFIHNAGGNIGPSEINSNVVFHHLHLIFPILFL